MNLKTLASTLLLFCLMCGAFSQSPVHLKGEKYLSALLDQSFLFDTTGNHHVHAPAAAPEDPELSWRNWRIVENFTYGKDRGSLPMIADLNSLHPYFRDRILALVQACKAQGIELAVVESFRTHAKQAEYFGMGRKYTRSRGGKSKHQYGLAVDVVPIIDAVAQWDNLALWKKVGVTGEKLGLRWGGRWRSPFDPAHFEWSGGINSYQLASGVQPLIPTVHAADYPCIGEEIVTLQKHWDAWEVEQAVSARSQAPGKASHGAGMKP